MLATCAALLIAAGLTPPSDQPPGSRGALTPGVLAVTNVTVIPMTRQTRVLRDATVVVRDGRIVAVGQRARPCACHEGARRIDGRGKYLVPGLADMHVHLYSDDEMPDSVAPATSSAS